MSLYGDIQRLQAKVNLLTEEVHERNICQSEYEKNNTMLNAYIEGIRTQFINLI